jgi:hypothetical protein
MFCRIFRVSQHLCFKKPFHNRFHQSNYFASKAKKGATTNEMIKVLNVAEKPSAAKQIASILSNNRYSTVILMCMY